MHACNISLCFLICVLCKYRYRYRMPQLSVQLCSLLTADIVETLARVGIKSVEGYVQCELVALSQTTNLPYRLLTSLRQALLAQFTSLPITAACLWQEMKDTAAFIPTGSSNVDQLLEGGVLTGELTELTGIPSSGKTQMCQSLAAAAVLQTSSTVLWVDPSGGFSATRLLGFLTASGASEEECTGLMERIHIHRLFNIFDLLDLLEEVSKQVSNQSDWFHTNLHLFLLDSVTSLLSPLLGSPGGQGHALLSHLALQLRLFAYEHSIAVVYTNNTVLDMTTSGGVKPALGRSWSCVPHTRISLSSLHSPPLPAHTVTASPAAPRQEEKGRREIERLATLTKSSRLGVGICTSFAIVDRGLLDSK